MDLAQHTAAAMDAILAPKPKLPTDDYTVEDFCGGTAICSVYLRNPFWFRGEDAPDIDLVSVTLDFGGRRQVEVTDPYFVFSDRQIAELTEIVTGQIQDAQP